MHPAFCHLVSDTFYGGSLRTPGDVAAARCLSTPLWFVDGQSEERRGRDADAEAEKGALAAVVHEAVQAWRGDGNVHSHHWRRLHVTPRS